MNLSTIEQGIFEQLGFSAIPDVAISGRIRRYENQTQRELLSMKGIGPKLRRATLAFNTVAGSPFVTLPQAAVSIFIVQDRTNSVTLEEKSISELRVRNPNLVTSGNPRAYAVVGYASQTRIDPSVALAGALTASSTSAFDTNTLTAYIEFLRTNHDETIYQTASAALNGVTPVTVGPTTPLYVSKFYISPTAGGNGSGVAGDVSLFDASGNIISVVGIGHTSARYTRLMLYPISASILTLYVDCELHIEDMTQGGDEPYLPEDFHDLIECGALKREYKKREKFQLYGIEDSRWRKRVAELRAYLGRPGKTFSERRPSRFSQLGPWFSDGA